ncbi:MAG: hypothetical protein BroJett015_14630 [Chloroflexota bacterium]|nr:MAG: hypothetical protein BroJett015_14630 [Chloroflexota bacterium]
MGCVDGVSEGTAMGVLVKTIVGVLVGNAGGLVAVWVTTGAVIVGSSSLIAVFVGAADSDDMASE